MLPSSYGRWRLSRRLGGSCPPRKLGSLLEGLAGLSTGWQRGAGLRDKNMEQLPHTAPDYALVAYWRARMLWSSRSVAAPEGEGKARQGYLDAAHDPACAEWARAAATAAPEWAKPHELLGLLLLLDAPKTSLSNGLGKGEGSAYWHLTRAVELDPTCGAAGAALVALLLMGSKAGAEGEGRRMAEGSARLKLSVLMPLLGHRLTAPHGLRCCWDALHCRGQSWQCGPRGRMRQMWRQRKRMGRR